MASARHRDTVACLAARDYHTVLVCLLAVQADMEVQVATGVDIIILDRTRKVPGHTAQDLRLDMRRTPDITGEIEKDERRAILGGWRGTWTPKP